MKGIRNGGRDGAQSVSIFSFSWLSKAAKATFYFPLPYIVSFRKLEQFQKCICF